MPDQNRPPEGGSRFEKLTKSVLETNHPLFVKVRRELPTFQHRHQFTKHPIWTKVKEITERHHVRRYALLFASAIVLSFFIYRQITDPYFDYKLGDVAQRHLIAQRTIEMEDEETTEAKKRSATDSVLSVYDYDRRMASQTRAKINRAFAVMHGQHRAVVNISERKGVSSADLERTAAFIEAKKAFSEILEIDFTDSQFESMVRLKFSQR